MTRVLRKLLRFTLILSALVLISCVIVTTWHGIFFILTRLDLTSDRGSIEQNFNCTKTIFSRSGVTTPFNGNKIRPDTNRLQWVVKHNVDAVVFSAYPQLLMKNSYPKRFKCPGTDRTITFRRSPWNVTGIGEADVIIVGCEVADVTWEGVKRIRQPQQVWVYTTGESAYFSPQVRSTKGIKPLGFGQDFRFNLSFMYHSKSEIVAPYGMYIPFSKNKQMHNAKLHLKARDHAKLNPRVPDRIVAWASSHCDKNFWNRTGFVEMLSRYIPIDKYGTCGKRPISYGIDGMRILQRYKFYLSFACCDEYITEKFWKALAIYKTVPIVIGASKSDYERVAPPNSFVFANDFNSAGDLARYIRRVANNETLYNEYHEWRKYGRVIELYGRDRIYPFTSAASACSLLNILEQNSLKGANPPLSMKLDPFGPEWLGSCKPCGEKEWINIFDLSSNGYNPIVYSQTIFYKFSDMKWEGFPVRGHAEKVYNSLQKQSSHK